MNDETKRIILDIQKYKGKDFAVLCCIEEMAELTQALLKDVNRHKDNRNDILEEFADVLFSLEHIKNIYDISDAELYEAINKKMPSKWSGRIKKWQEREESKNQGKE